MLKAMRKGLKVSLAQKQPEYMFSTSIGIAQFGKDGSDFETLFKIADAALYIAKEKGKDRYIIYDYNKENNELIEIESKIGKQNKLVDNNINCLKCKGINVYKEDEYMQAIYKLISEEQTNE